MKSSNRLIPSNSQRYRRRGGAYVMVLTTSMLVAILGITSVTVNRIKYRSGASASQISQAELLAQSSVEMGLYTIDRYDRWYNTIENDKWITQTISDTDQVQWKIVDVDAVGKAIDPNNELWLYGRGVNGDAVRVISVMLTPSHSSNQLSNTSAESGVSPWTEVGDAIVTQSAANPRTGNFAFQIEAAAGTAGIGQKIQDKIVAGDSYSAAVWYRASTLPDIGQLALMIETTDGTRVNSIATTSVESKEWTRIEGIITPTWTGDLLDATLIGMSETEGASYQLDDFYFAAESETPYAMDIVQGTWKREVDTN
ncbi:MAG: carbohydrate binding domain-containing protein [Phycisphaerae bacterium]